MVVVVVGVEGGYEEARRDVEVGRRKKMKKFVCLRKPMTKS